LPSSASTAIPTNVTICPPRKEALVGLVIVIQGGVLTGTSAAAGVSRSSAPLLLLDVLADDRSPVDGRAAADGLTRAGLLLPVGGA